MMNVFDVNKDNKDLEYLIDEEDNPFFKTIKKVVNMLQIGQGDQISSIMEENILMVAHSIEEHLERFLMDVNIPFSSEIFLLILFNELYVLFNEKKKK